MEAEDAGLRARERAARQTIDRNKRERILLNEKAEMLKERSEESNRTRVSYLQDLQKAEKCAGNGITKADSSAAGTDRNRKSGAFT